MVLIDFLKKSINYSSWLYCVITSIAELKHPLTVNVSRPIMFLA